MDDQIKRRSGVNCPPILGLSAIRPRSNVRNNDVPISPLSTGTTRREHGSKLSGPFHLCTRLSSINSGQHSLSQLCCGGTQLRFVSLFLEPVNWSSFNFEFSRAVVQNFIFPASQIERYFRWHLIPSHTLFNFLRSVLPSAS